MRKSTIAVAAVTAATMGAAFQAHAYPDRPIEFVIPFAQGGGTDTVARAIAEYIKPHLGDTYAANREGGGGAIGFRYGADASPDGHVVTMLVTTLATAPHLVEGYPVTYEDFAPVCLISALPVVMSARTGSPVSTLDGLLKEAADRSTPLSFGTGGVATYQHLAGVAFTQAADIDADFVPYDGAGPVLTATFGGHIDVALSEASEVLPWVEDGRMEVVAVFDDKPFAAFPDAPLARDHGFDVQVGAFRGLGAPKDTPPEILETLVEACRATTEDQAFVDHMASMGIEVDPIFGEEFGEWLANQHATFAEAAEALENGN